MRALVALVTLPVLGIAAHGIVPATPQPPETDPVDIREWEVPWEESRPRDPYVGPDDRVWFVGQRTHYVAVLDPETGEFRKHDLDDGTGPHNLVVAEDGTVWYAGNRAAHIGRMDPQTGQVHKIPTEVRDPHTLIFNREGDIWFTAQGANHVGKLDTDTENLRYFPVPTERARPYGIVMDRHEADRPWIVLLGTNKLATVDPGADHLREIVFPEDGARPRRLGMTSDGTVWMADYAQGKLWSYVPEDDAFRSWDLPGGSDSRPYALAVDARDRVWLVETGSDPNRFVGFDTDAEEFFSITEIPSGGGTLRHMVYDAEDHEIWFGADTNTIGRARLP